MCDIERLKSEIRAMKQALDLKLGLLQVATGTTYKEQVLECFDIGQSSLHKRAIEARTLIPEKQLAAVLRSLVIEGKIRHVRRGVYAKVSR